MMMIIDKMMMANSEQAGQVLEELSDGAHSTRGADTPAMDLISQIPSHTAPASEKRILIKIHSFQLAFLNDALSRA